MTPRIMTPGAPDSGCPGQNKQRPNKGMNKFPRRILSERNCGWRKLMCVFREYLLKLQLLLRFCALLRKHNLCFTPTPLPYLPIYFGQLKKKKQYLFKNVVSIYNKWSDLFVMSYYFSLISSHLTLSYLICVCVCVDDNRYFFKQMTQFLGYIGYILFWYN